jgi:hypothetical protein
MSTIKKSVGKLTDVSALNNRIAELTKEGPLNLSVAMKLAVENQDFAKALVADPKKFATQFNLGPHDIAALLTVGKYIGGLKMPGGPGGGLNEWYE